MCFPQDVFVTDLPLGPCVDEAPRPFPERRPHDGQAVRLEPLDVGHAPDLWRAATDGDASWAYLRYGPFDTEAALAAHVAALAAKPDQPFFAALPASSGAAEGWLSYRDISPANAAIEVGGIWFSPRLQRTRAATEAVFLLLRHAFDDLGYRRLVWRCNALNAASCRAAERFGFSYEGTWRAADVVKGRQRDTAWYSLLASEWPDRRTAFAAWLDKANFDAQGRARQPMARPAPAAA